MGRFLLVCSAVALLAGCSSSSRPSAPTIAPARTFELSGFEPLSVARAGPTRLSVTIPPPSGPPRPSFTIRQPSGQPLTDYRRGAGPHTGVHVIIVRRDLGVIIHRHPPIGPNGRIVEEVDLPTPGPYRV